MGSYWRSISDVRRHALAAASLRKPGVCMQVKAIIGLWIDDQFKRRIRFFGNRFHDAHGFNTAAIVAVAVSLTRQNQHRHTKTLGQRAGFFSQSCPF